MVLIKEFIKKIEDLVTPFLDKEGIELVDVEWAQEPAGRFLRFFIDTEEGVSLDTCAKVSEALSRVLDQADIVSESYVLEVSSPGIERPLKKPKHFTRFVDSEIYVKIFKPIDGRKEFKGILKSVSERGIVIEYNNKLLDIPFDLVAKARSVADLFSC